MPDERTSLSTPAAGPRRPETPAGAAAPPVVLVVGDVVDDDVVRPLEPLVWGGETRARIAVTPGGSAANQAAWLGALGAHVRFAGRVGAADVARHAAELRRHGVDARLAADAAAPTGAIVIIVRPDGDRDMYADPGANRNLAVADLGDDLLDGVGHVHLSGYTFFTAGPRAAVTDLAGRAAARGVGLSVDPASAAFLRDTGPSVFLEWTRGMRVIFPNLDEGRVLAARTDPDEVVGVLVRHYPVVVLKLGAAGVLAATAEGLRLRAPAAAVEVADTTGAGDAFCAGFLAGWTGPDGPSARDARAGALPDCVARGQETAARAVARLGARPPGATPSRSAGLIRRGRRPV